MNDTIDNTVNVSAEIDNTPAVEPSADTFQAAATKLDEAPVPTNFTIYDEFADFPDDDELTSRERGEQVARTLDVDQLLVMSLALSLARGLKAVAYKQQAGTPESFIDLVADLASEHSDAEMKEAAEVFLAEMKARQGAEKVEG